MEKIRIYAPEIIFLVQDGPRSSVPSDIENVSRVRQVLESVDWDCKVHRLYSDSNLGLLARFESALSKIFATVESCIILEDDVLPSETFFHFISAALEDFRDDLRVGMISGYCETKGSKSILKRRFSRKPKVWGWATWSDRVSGYEPNHNEFATHSPWQSFLMLRRRGFSLVESVAWPRRIHRGIKIRTWDYQWAYHVLSKFGYSLAPSANLISNLGFGDSSTNTVLTPPFINFEIEPSQNWYLDRSIPKISLAGDRLETARRVSKMLSSRGLLTLVRKLSRL